MPTVVIDGPFRVKVFGPPREHPPPHVHVYRGKEVLAIIRLPINNGPAVLWAVYDARPIDVVRAFELVEAYAVRLQQAWDKIHD